LNTATLSVSTDPVVLVTGAAGGLGRAVVSKLRACKMRVWATDIALAEIACGEAGVNSSSLDATDESAIETCISRILSEWGRLDHVVHLAGRPGVGPLASVSRADWQSVLDVNLTSAFLIAKASRLALFQTKGSLIFTSSTNALNGGSALSGPAYAVAKSGLINLTRYLAKEWADHGVRVNCLAPGPIETPMVIGRFSPDVVAKLKASVPLGCIGTPHQVAHAVAYLTSPEAAFITGTVMNISGGLVMD